MHLLSNNPCCFSQISAHVAILGTIRFMIEARDWNILPTMWRLPLLSFGKQLGQESWWRQNLCIVLGEVLWQAAVTIQLPCQWSMPYNISQSHFTGPCQVMNVHVQPPCPLRSVGWVGVAAADVQTCSAGWAFLCNFSRRIPSCNNRGLGAGSAKHAQRQWDHQWRQWVFPHLFVLLHSCDHLPHTFCSIMTCEQFRFQTYHQSRNPVITWRCLYGSCYVYPLVRCRTCRYSTD